MARNHQLKTTAALVLALGAIAPGAATASPIGGNPVAAAATQSSQSPIVRVIVPTGGFDWGDAGIGAAGGLALSMLGLGGALVISSRRRARHPTTPPAPTG
jgi:hypothetical protein